jgi:hypothetical protein
MAVTDLFLLCILFRVSGVSFVGRRNWIWNGNAVDIEDKRGVS